MNNSNIKVVVSKYTEDIEWTNKITRPVLIYDKSQNPIEGSISRPNIGREAETLLYYIITNYNSLPDITIFLQGDPRSNPVAYSYEQVIDEINKPHEYTLKTILTWEGNLDIKKYWLKSCSLLHGILFNDSEYVRYSSGVQYVIPKENILHRPLDFYITLHMLVVKYGHQGLQHDLDTLNKGIDAWTLELMWKKIFDTNIELNNNWKIKLFKLLS
jgi:hypothetical protein